MLTNEQIIQAVKDGINSAMSAIRDTVEAQHNSSEQQSQKSVECQPEIK